ncbi:MAG: hypothetical protein AB7S80_07025 [Rhizobiaceae bacterium]
MPRCSLSAIGATIATLAFLAIFYTVYSNSDSITRGVGSLAGIPSGLTPLTVLPLACLAIAIAHFTGGRLPASRCAPCARTKSRRVHPASASSG